MARTPSCVHRPGAADLLASLLRLPGASLIDGNLPEAGIALKIPLDGSTDEWREGWDRTMAVEYLAYAASKGGVVALTRSIARTFGKSGICAFVLAPGLVRTGMAQDFIDEYGEDRVIGELALDRLTEPSDLTPLVVLLASGLADHATGATFDINAGSYVR